VPALQPVPLWDLDSDAALHNRSLNPPEPFINRVVFHDMLHDIRAFLACASADAGDAAAAAAVAGAAVAEEAKYRKRVTAKREEAVSASDVLVESDGNAAAAIAQFKFDLKAALQRYYVKAIDASPRESARGDSTYYNVSETPSMASADVALTRVTSVGAAVAASLTTTTVTTATASVPDATATMSLALPVAVASAVNTADYIGPTAAAEVLPPAVCASIARSEKRKFISQFMKSRLNSAIEHWWRRAVDTYEARYQLNLYIPASPDFIVSRSASCCCCCTLLYSCFYITTTTTAISIYVCMSKLIALTAIFDFEMRASHLCQQFKVFERISNEHQ
jgi:hypothetical protein